MMLFKCPFPKRNLKLALPNSGSTMIFDYLNSIILILKPMGIRNIIYFILCCLGTVSCEPDNSTVMAPQVVLMGDVNGYIYPGVLATLRWTNNLNAVHGDDISDAELWLLKDGTRLLKLPWVEKSSTFKGYYTDYQPTVGHTYRLEAHIPNHPVVWVETKIPEPVPFEVVGIYPMNGKDWPQLVLQIAFTDPVGEENFYRLDARSMQHDFYQEMPPRDPIFDRYGMPFDKTAKRSFFEFSDKSIEGQRYVVDCYFSINSFNPILPDTFSVCIDFKMLSKSYYWFSRTTHLQSLQLTDPFSEPVQVYSDAVNGLGTFQSYTSVTDTVLCRRQPDGQWTIDR